MKLREFFYIDKDTLETVDDMGYDPSRDSDIRKFSDKRKTKLTLAQINSARLASDKHKELKKEELVFIRQMYGTPAEAAV